MITKGIIESVDLRDNHYVIRVPIFEIAGNEYKNEIEAIASISPGSFNGYKENDVVLVGFEDNRSSKGVILGKLFLGIEDESKRCAGAVQCENLVVSNKAVLPADIRISFSPSEDISNQEVALTNLTSINDIINAIRTNSKNITELTNRAWYSVDYSDSEQVIANWVNGSFIYRKTFIIDCQNDPDSEDPESKGTGQHENEDWEYFIDIPSNYRRVEVITSRSFAENNKQNDIEISYEIVDQKIRVWGHTEDYKLTNLYLTIEYMKK